MKKLFSMSSFFALGAGALLVVAGIGGALVTYQSIARENIVTPSDASVPGRHVRGPFTLKSQADIIRVHTLKSTGGKTFAEMPREIPKLGAGDAPILDSAGKPVLVPNTARDIWITSTTLTTALNMGLLAYGVSALSLLLGIAFIWAGILLRLFVRHTFRHG